jgi:hypothetical protein
MSKDLIVRIAHNLVKTIEENNNFNKIIYEKKHIFKIYVHTFIIKNIGDTFQMSYLKILYFLTVHYYLFSPIVIEDFRKKLSITKHKNKNNKQDEMK